MFVVYIGYGCIVMLGEEVNDLCRNILRVMIVMFVVFMFLYVVVVIVSVIVMGMEDFVLVGAMGVVLFEMIVWRFMFLGIVWIVVVGVIIVMFGVFLNLIFGFFCVVMVMGCRGDLFFVFVRLNRS